jgi:hypothetical protein
MAKALVIKKTDSLFDEVAGMQSRVMQRANEIFRSNGHIHGREVDDWLKANVTLGATFQCSRPDQY